MAKNGEREQPAKAEDEGNSVIQLFEIEKGETPINLNSWFQIVKVEKTSLLE